MELDQEEGAGRLRSGRRAGTALSGAWKRTTGSSVWGTRQLQEGVGRWTMCWTRWKGRLMEERTWGRRPSGASHCWC